jgi:hypothetical protein
MLDDRGQLLSLACVRLSPDRSWVQFDQDDVSAFLTISNVALNSGIKPPQKQQQFYLKYFFRGVNGGLTTTKRQKTKDPEKNQILSTDKNI